MGGYLTRDAADPGALGGSGSIAGSLSVAVETRARERIVVVSASVGGGHDGVADELCRRFGDAGHEVDRYDYLDLLGDRSGRALRRAYAVQLAVAPRSWGWLIGGLERHGRLAGAVGGLLTGPSARSRTRRCFDADGGTRPAPSVVVSTYPLASQLLGRMRRTGALSAPVVTFLTDLSVHPLWVAGGVDLHIALHEVAAAQARRHARGAAGGFAVEVCAPVVRPAFSAGAGTDAATLRARWGLPPTGPLALVVAGSWGAGEVAEAAADLAATGLVTPVVACGRNGRLRDRVARAGTGVALGWVDRMSELIRACDVVVQNAGGLTSLEAMACGVPVLSYRCLPGHGTANARALHEAGLAAWVPGPDALVGTLRGILGGDLGRRQRGAAARLFGAPAAADAILAVAGARR